jgi:hypothetical protein
MTFELAQVNVARLEAPLTDPQLKDFVDALDPVNAIADAAPGFVWRLQTEDGNATAVRAFEWDTGDSAGMIVNLTVWQSIEELAEFTYSGWHRELLRRRRDWFQHMREAVTALWWVPAGHRPSTDEAEDRIRHLRAHGPTPQAFTLKVTFPPGSDVSAPGRPDWLCPA